MHFAAASTIVAVGDTPYDAEAAAQVGIATIGLTCGGAFGEQELRLAGCVAICNGPSDLLELLARKRSE
jgi:phosphoglycolate phosphatase-like HAD superfamily hydrolase